MGIAHKKKDAVKKKAARERAKERKRVAQVAPAFKKAFPTVPESHIEYSVPEAPVNADDPMYESFKAAFETLTVDGDAGTAAPQVGKTNKAQLREQIRKQADSGDEEEELPRKRKRKKVDVSNLKGTVLRPDVVQESDTTGPDPALLVFLKAYRNSVHVPIHWCSKRRYLSGKKGNERPRYQLPAYIQETGIEKIRKAVMDREEAKGIRGMARAKLAAKMGKLDIDYQVLHDAFFKYQTRPPLTGHNDIYYEGKEMEVKMSHKRPGQFSEALMEALGMKSEDDPPPWLFNMQRYGPPPAYPNMKFPGINTRIPEGGEYGFQANGWGKPPVDEFGKPLYGDWATGEEERRKKKITEALWGQVEDVSDDEEMIADSTMEQSTVQTGQSTPFLGASGSATPMMGHSTPGHASVRGGSSHGFMSTSGISSVTSHHSGFATPGSRSAHTRGIQSRGISSVSQGISSATLTPSGPQLFQVLQQQGRGTGGGLFPSSHGYRAGTASRMGIATPSGISTPGGITSMSGHGINTPGIATPGYGIATPGIATPGMATPFRGIATPGIATPGIATPGIATPGIATPSFHGIATPSFHGIATPSMHGIATPGISTPMGGIATPGIATPMGGIATPGMATPMGGIATPSGIVRGVHDEGMMTADIIRNQLKQHEEQAEKAKLAAGHKDKKKKAGNKKSKFKF